MTSAGAPLSHGQARLWFLSRLEGPSSSYNIALTLQFKGSLDVEALSGAIADVVARHAPLRTMIREVDGVPSQHVVPGDALDLELVPTQCRQADLASRLAFSAGWCFDLSTELPIRADLWRLAPDEHVLALVIHHIAMDGVSVHPLFADLAAAYGVRRRSGAEVEVGSALDALPVEYADYAGWLRVLLGDEADAGSLAAEQLAYWRATLAGSPAEVELTTDRPRPERPTADGGIVVVPLADDLSHDLIEIGRRRGATPFMVGQAAVVALLHRLGAGDDIPLGVPVAGRLDEALESLVGFFVNTLVVRTDVSGDPTFDDLVGRVRTSTLGAFAHQELPFEMVVEGVNPERVANRNPLFQFMVSYQPPDPAEVAFDGVTAVLLDPVITPSQFDLSFDFYALGGDRLELRVAYSGDLFDRVSVEVVASRLVRVLEAVTADPSVRVGAIDVLAEGEEPALTSLGRGRVESREPVSLVDAFEACAADHADEVALVTDERVWSFAELRAASDQVAYWLVGRGVDADVVVALSLPRTLVVIGQLGVLAAGGAFLIIDPELPAGRRQQLLDESAAHLVVDETVLSAILAAPPSEGDRRRVADPAPPSAAAYVCFTSGSTGVPKGVVVPRAALANLLATHKPSMAELSSQLGRRVRVALTSAFSFDASWGALLWLFAGHEVHVIGGYRDPLAVVGAVRERGLDYVDVTPSYLAELERAGLLADDVSTPAVLVVGGEATSPVLWNRLRSLHCASGVSVRDLYGPTESTVDAFWWWADGSQGAVANTSVLVLDPWLRPAPVGVAGELHVVGASLARAYVGRPGLTAERFVACPFGPPGSRMYRTGDLARWDRDGRLRLIGRTDEQVKVRGFRIEPAEVEAVLADDPAVAAAAVVVREDDPGVRRLAAYVVPTEGRGSLDASRLRDGVAAVLPDYMVPAAFVVVDRLPLTVHGKLDREALPAPSFASVGGRGPRNDRERVLCGLMAGVLRLPEVSIDDNFFHLGGDSIVSIQFVVRARSAGLVLTPRDVFERPTVAGLAAVAADVADGSREVGARDGIGQVPATAALRWLQRQGGDCRRFNQSVTLRPPGDLTLDRLVAGLQAVIDHHDLLRARLDRATPEWTLDVAERGVVDAAGLVAVVDGPIREVAAAAAVDALDPDERQMLQVVWSPAGRELLVVAHHAVVDIVSWPILIADLAAATDDPAVLLPRTAAFRTHAMAIVAQAEAQTRAQDHVPAAHVAEVAVDEPLIGSRRLDRTVDLGSTATRMTTSVDTATTRTLLTDVPAAYHTGVETIIYAAIARAVVDWRGRTGPVHVNRERHGRDGTDLDVTRTVGWFTTEHLTTLNADQKHIADLIKAVKEQLAAPDHRLRRTIAPQININYAGRIDTAATGDWARLAHDVAPDGTSTMPIAHVLDIHAETVDVPSGPELRIIWTWPEAIVERAELERLAALLDRTLHDIADHITQADAGGHTPSDFPLVELTQADVEHLEGVTNGLIDDIVPLAPLQQGLLFHAATAGDTPDYIPQMTLDLTGPLEPERLRAAADSLLTRHESLRLSFRCLPDGRPVAVVASAVPMPWHFVDLIGEADPIATMSGLARRELDEGFVVSEAPLLRMLLVRLGPERHRLVITEHHLLLDGWSGPVFVDELFAAYRSGGHTGDLAPVTPYRSYLAWLASQDERAATAAWAEELAGIDEPTLLAPRASASRDGATETGHEADPAMPLRQLPIGAGTDLGSRLSGLARQAGVTLNTVVQAAWAILVATQTGRTDVVFGHVTSGRPAELAGVERMLGLLINTTPVRVTLDLGETIVELLGRVQARQTKLLAHEHLPLVGIQRASGHQQLFDTLVVFESYPDGSPDANDEVDAAELQVAVMATTEATHYPVALTADPSRHRSDRPSDDRSDDLGLTLDYRTDLVGTGEAEALAARLTRILVAMAADTEQPLAALDLLTDEERRLVVDEWNDTDAIVPTTSLPVLLQAQVVRTPDAPAVVFEGTTLTYAELDQRANRLAWHLVAAGVATGDIVALAVPRSLELMVALVAVQKAGAAYLPLDADQPVARLAQILRAARPFAILTTELLAPAVAEAKQIAAAVAPIANADVSTGVADPGTPRVYVLDAPAFQARLDRSVDTGPVERMAAVPGQSPAYVLYTSGSTGTPKGVIVPHAGIVNRLLWMQAEYRLAPGDRVLQKTPITFDVSVWELFWPIMVGATLVIAKPEGHKDPAYLAQLIQVEQIDTIHFVPSMLQAFVAEPSIAGCTSLRRMICSGEALPAPLVAEVQQVIGQVEVHNLYGPTEASVDVTAWPCPPMSPAQAAVASVPIGRPVWNTRLHVLDAALRPVPPGVSGELYLSGIQLASGYLGRPGLTAERFVASPFGPAGSRLYRTGDLARWSADGAVEYLGRTDQQVKVRGQRVELGEIESVVSGIDGVGLVAVVARPDHAGSAQLVAYVVAAAHKAAPPVEVLRTHCTATLPDHMVPAAFVVVDSLPLTASGKLDRKALPDPDFAASARRGRTRTAREEILAPLFADVLGLPDIGVDDDFFALGGHSLLAMRLVNQARAVFEVDLPVRALFDGPTVARLAAALDSTDGGPRPRLQPSGPHGSPAGEPLPASFAQQRLWFFHELEGPSATYNLIVARRISGGLVPSAFAAACLDVVGRHESLRTTLTGVEGEVRQVVWTPADARASLPIAVVEAGSPAEIRCLLDQAAGYEFVLDRELPIRVTIIETGSAEHVVALVIHHVAADEWSYEPLLRDLAEAYAAQVATGAAPADWQALPVQYADYAGWQRDLLGDPDDTGSLAARQLGFWSETLLGCPDEIVLPTDRPRPPEASHRGGSVPVDIPSGVAEGLRRLARARGATMFMVVHAAVAALLHRLGAGDDIVIGAPTAGRADPVLDDLVGFFVNTLVLRADLAGDPSFAELVDRVRAADLAAFDQQDVPFEQVVERLNPERSLARHPLVQVMVSHLPAGGDRLGLPGLIDLDEPFSDDVAKFDLTFDFTDGADGQLLAAISYATELFDESTVVQFAARLNRLLAAAAGDPTLALSRIDLLDEQERAALLAVGDGSTCGRPAGVGLMVPEVSFVELFDAQVRRTPDSIALVYEERTMTYAEVDAAATRLATGLQTIGAGRGTVVAVALPRSLQLVVGLVAVLKSGAAYLALDLEYPPDRLAFMLHDSQPVAIVVEDPSQSSVTADGPWSLVGYDGDLSTADSDAGDYSPPTLTTADAAYVIYTSGTTGMPKAVVVTHDGVGKLVATQADRLGFGPGSRMTQFASPSFDVAFWELCLGLLVGGSLVIIPADRRVAGEPLTSYLAAHEVTHAGLPPSLVAALPEGSLPDDLVLMVGTERVAPDLVRRWGAGRRRMFNCYGPTEATVNATLGLCEWRGGGEAGGDGAAGTGGAAGVDHGRVPIGRPDPGVRAYVLDDTLQLVPAGVPGELYLGGRGLARGYLGRPGLTAERFVADPFGPPGCRLYRTGDLVRWTADGQLDFLGRTDEQLKVRGYRIEPGEIENALTTHPSVQQAAVIARDDAPGLTRLVAYVRLADDDGAAAATPTDLRQFLAGRLPEHLVPAAVVLLDVLPVLPSGKLDRRALPEPDWAELVGDDAPRDAAEETVAAVMAGILGLERVGIHDDFFALGGDSIVAMQLVARARRAGVGFTARQVFAARTVAGLVAVAGGGETAAESRPMVSSSNHEPGPTDLVALSSEESIEVAGIAGLDEVLPLSPLQEGLLFLATFDPGTGGGSSAGASDAAGMVDPYTVQMVAELEGPVDPERLRLAGQALLDRHANLRASFRYLASGRPVALIAGPVLLPWSAIDLRTMAPQERDAAWDALLAEQARRFEPSRAPLLRMAFVRWTDDEARLVLTHQHLILDGWSRAPLLAELSNLYRATATDAGVSGVPVRPSYRDHLAWLATHDRQAALAVWREALAGIDEPTLLVPADPDRPTALPHTLDLVLPADLTSAAVEVGRRAGLTLNTLVQVAWGIVLGRVTGRREVVFGATVSGRPPELAGVEDMIGLFINTVPVRVAIDPAEPIGVLLARVQDQQMALTASHQVGLADIHRQVGLGDLFDTLLVFENYPDASPNDGEGDGDGLPLRNVVGRDATHYPLAWLVEPGEVLTLVAEYRADLLTERVVERLATGIEAVLRAIVADLLRPVGAIAITGEGDRARVVDAWNDSSAPVEPATLPDLFLAQLARTPDEVALVSPSEGSEDRLELSYAQASARIAQLARHLLDLGVEPGDHVAVVLPRSVDLVVAVHAIHQAGAAYVPIDPDHPTDRVAAMLADAAPAAVLTTAEIAADRSVLLDGLLPSLREGDQGAALVALDDPATRQALALRDPSPVGRHERRGALTPAHPAYLIYTSGSTGTPKGVVVPHEGIVNRLLWMQSTYGLAVGERVVHKTPATFDVSVWELFWPMMVGATLVIAKPEGHKDPAYLANLFRTEAVSTAHFVPSMLQAFVAELSARGCPALRRVICSGESLPTELARSFTAISAAELHNLYGPTEASVDVTAWPWSLDIEHKKQSSERTSTSTTSVPGATASVPIGRPLWNTQLYVLDAGLRPQPPGLAGELYLAGVQLATAYRNRPSLTAERFVANPFGGPGSRLYRTGDLARWRDDGVLEFLGRTDHQVKLRGLRIELGEIEAALTAQSVIDQAVVVAREDRPGRQQLVAYLVGADAGRGSQTSELALDVDSVRAVLDARLPDYMVPTAFVVLDELPLTSNGKLDRRALPAPDWTPEVGTAEPRSPVEQVLAGAFAGVLGLERVGVDDDFFALGGDSIVAMLLVVRARRDGVIVTPRQVFTQRTVAKLAEVAELGDARSASAPLDGHEPVASSPTSLLALTPTEVDEIAELDKISAIAEVWPLAPLQQGLLFLTAYDSTPGNDVDVYTVQMAFELQGPVDPTRLRAAGQSLLDRLPNLRAGFRHLRSGRAVATVATHVALPWHEVDLAGLRDAEREEAWSRLLDHEGRRFDPATPPLLRMAVARLGRDRWRLAITHQHLILDGWSRGPLLAELSAAYEAAGSDGGSTAGPAEEPGYRDFLAWLTAQDEAAALAAWSAALDGIEEPTRLVAADPERTGAVPALVDHELTEDLTAHLSAVGRDIGVTMNSLVQAAWAVVLGRWTGRSDVVFGATVSGRPPELAGVEDMIGLFINTVPVRVRLDPACSVGELVARVQDEQLELARSHHLGLAEIQRQAGVGELFDTLVVFENYPDAGSRPGPSESFRVVDGNGRDATHYPLTWLVEPGDRLALVAEYQEQCLDRATVEQLMKAMETVLTSMASPGGLARTVASLDVVAEAERDRILGTWNETTLDVPAGTLADLFERQAMSTPEVVALVGVDGTFTFVEVAERVNRLARLLIDLGAGPETIVALALPRTAEMMVAILATLTAGAAYLPVDPGYPADHISAMVDDARPVLLVTDASVAEVLPAAPSAAGGSQMSTVVLDHPDTVSELASRSPAPLTDDDRRAPLREQHPAYVIYTSGSTGKPKGVVITHASIVRLFASHRETLYRPTVARTGRRHLQVGHAWSFSFDASWQPQLWLFDGHAVHVLGEETQRDSNLLLHEIRARSLDFLEVTPSHFGQMATAGLVCGDRCPLAVVGVGGEAVPDSLWEALGRLEGTEAFNLYGPTESTVDALVARVGGSERAEVGRPVHNTKAYVLDTNLRPVPVGVTGELYLSGGGLARGYLGRPALTAERFVADPFGDAGSRLYRTGDLASWTPRGTLVLAGRTDEQIKIRGFRVEPGEIELALGRHAGVGEALVVVREDVPRVKRLVAYVVPLAGRELAVSELHDHVAGVLPAHMVPAAFVLLERFPLMANGKVDKAGLPAPDPAALATGRAPRTDREILLSRIVADLVGLPAVGVDDDFFALGGDSLLAMQLVSRAGAAGMMLSARQVFTGRTVERLAELAASLDADRAVDTSAPVRGLDPATLIPLTPIMHWLQSVAGPTEGFNQTALVQVPAAMTEATLVMILRALADCHEMLRARLVPVVAGDDGRGDRHGYGGWALEVQAQWSIDVASWVERVDVAGAANDKLVRQIEEAARTAQDRLDPKAGAMVQAVWFDAGREEPGRLLVVIHHLVVDGVSWRILLPDMELAYDDIMAGRSPALDPVPTTFRRWASALVAEAADPVRVAELDGWLEIAGRPGRLPIRRILDATVDTTETLQELTVSLPAADTSALLTSVPSAYGATIDDVLLAALAMAVVTSTSDHAEGEAPSGVTVALERHGREESLFVDADLSRAVGWFTSVVPVHLRVSRADAEQALAGSRSTAAEIVRSVSGRLQAMPDHGIGYGLLRYLNSATSEVLASADQHPQIQFNYLGRFDHPGCSDWAYARESDAVDIGADAAMPAGHVLTIDAHTEDRPGGPVLEARFTWPGGVLDDGLAREVAERWMRALRGLQAAAAEPSQVIDKAAERITVGLLNNSDRRPDGQEPA